MNRRTTIAMMAALLPMLWTATSRELRAAELAANWSALEEEAIRFLSRYIQIDTTNPPGNEIKAARFFKEIFVREGIEAQIIESSPARGNIYARLPGAGSRKAILLLNHMDVVPADAEFWREAPFSGLIKSGMIWGRGALDDKGSAILELMSLLVLKRQRVPLKADVIFLGTADEEAGGAFGVGYLMEKHSSWFDQVGVALNEGGRIRVGQDGRARSCEVGVAEKTPLWLRLTASGKPGHGSTPDSDLAVNRLIAALSRLAGFQSPIKVVAEVQKYYGDIASSASPKLRGRYANLRRSLEDRAFAAEFTKDARNNASVRNTIAITRVRGSDKVNVIPSRASAEVDIRLLPGEEPKAFIEAVRRIIADDAIKIETILSFPAAISPAHPEAMKAIGELARKYDDGAPVIAPLGRGFTDCHFFRERGIPCLGFMPLRSGPDSRGLVHGVDERITIDNLKFGVRAMYELVHNLAAH